jgi:hypothetical protein
MREIGHRPQGGPSGSVGGETGKPVFPTPIVAAVTRRRPCTFDFRIRRSAARVHRIVRHGAGV